MVERTQLHFDRDGGRSVRENFSKNDGGALTREDNPKLQRRETGDFGGGTPYNNSSTVHQQVVQQQAALGTMPSHRFFSVIIGCFNFAI